MPPPVYVPAPVTLAPLNVNAVVGVEPDLITSSPLLFVKLPKVVPSSFNVTSAPPASRIISAAASTVTLFEVAIVKLVPSPSIFSPSSPKVTPTPEGMFTSLVAVKLISAPEVTVRSVLSPSIFHQSQK